MTYQELLDQTESSRGLQWASSFVTVFGPNTQAQQRHIDLVRRKDADEYQK